MHPSRIFRSVICSTPNFICSWLMPLPSQQPIHAMPRSFQKNVGGLVEEARTAYLASTTEEAPLFYPIPNRRDLNSPNIRTSASRSVKLVMTFTALQWPSSSVKNSLQYARCTAENMSFLPALPRDCCLSSRIHRSYCEKHNATRRARNGGHRSMKSFICGCVGRVPAARSNKLASRKLLALTALVKPWHENKAEWGFNEWIQAQSGKPSGRDWQTWSAAMYLYAAECVDRQGTPFFSAIRTNHGGSI